MNTVNLPQQSPSMQDPANAEVSIFEKDRIQQHIEKHGHQAIFSTHECPCCGADWKCRSNSCRRPQEHDCRECAALELQADVRRICNQIVIQRHVTSEQLGWLKGLAERAEELEMWES